MSAPLLRRLHQPRDLDSAAQDRRRWCSVAGSGWAAAGPTGVGAPLWSSGRRAAPGLLLAERLDDGLLVAATAELAAEPIVWLGDVVAAAFTGADEEITLGVPRVRLGAVTPRVEVVWAVDARVAHLECTFPCRPVGQRTFENETLDPRVQLESTDSGGLARLRPYPGLPAITVRFNGEVTLEGAATWESAVAVLDREGPAGTEDRFSPGTFVVRLPDGARSLRMSVEVEAELAEGRPAASELAPPPLEAPTDRERLLDLLAAPGLALDGAWTPDHISTWIQAHAAQARLAIGGPGEQARDDSALWLGRACQLLLRNLRGTWGPLTYRGLVEDCFVPAIRSLVDAVLEAPYAEGSSAPDESGEGDEPGAARFRGSARWYEVLGCTEVEERGAVAVETAALLHQLLIFDEQLSRMVSDTPRAEVAAGRALSCRRWFQRAFWLPTPRRLADLEVERADPIGGAALAMRAGMLIAASLEGAPLDQIQRRSIVNASDQRLLTPLGLRSIDRADRGFRSDSASDGAVWPWLLGLHAEAAIRAFGRDHGRLEFQETLLSATDGAPEAWLESEDGGVMPTGDLSFSPARGESARAFRLLSEILGEDDGR